MAGLLTPLFEKRLPNAKHKWHSVIQYMRDTAAGTVPDLNRIPY